jgi:Cu2+-exporting ATPase
VIAGSINLSQPVEVEVISGGNETTLSSLGRLLLQAQSRRLRGSEIPQWLVPVFIVAVLLVAGLTWAGWQLVYPPGAFPAMLAVLVASCPCALSLALPVVYAAASYRLLDEGILLTRGEALDALARIDTVVFDKTGTLTCGSPEIVSIELNPERESLVADEVLQITAALESRSAHPIAQAFRLALEAAKQLPAVQAATVHPGLGMSGLIDGKAWRIGQAGFARTGKDMLPDHNIWLSDSVGWVARFVLQDSVRAGAVSTIRWLRRNGLVVEVLSGDSLEPVNDIADRLQIETRHARQSPAMKLQRIESLRSEARCVLMIGDGVNDAPVLAGADVSMSVKGGADLANSAADMILTTDSLEPVTMAIEIARKTKALVRQNLVWAAFYNASIMPLAVFGLLQPWMAALGMSLSSLLVVANASRLVRTRQSPKAVRMETELEAGAA